MREPAQGQIIAGKYRIESLIGHGGMGSVWRARHESLDMPVAIKFMGAHTAGDVEARQRFEREARALASLRTPNIVQVLDHGIDDDAPYIVMELLEGEDLSARMAARRRLPLDEVSRILSQTARALRRAHEAGITHRDLKPSNVFLAQVDGEEVVKVLDFGVAKLAAVGALGDQLTKVGTLLGSPGYMSPEQARGKDVDFRSDLWALAVIVFRAVTGVKPFAGDSIAELVIKLCIDPRPVATRIAADLPPEVDRFFEKAFAAEPQDRFQSAVEMATAFAQMVGAPVELSRLGPSPISAAMRASASGASPVSTWTGSLSGNSPSPSSGAAAAPVGPLQTTLGFPVPAAVSSPTGSMPTPRPSRPSSPPEPAQTMLLMPSPREPTPTPASFGGFAPALADTSSVAPKAGSAAPLPEGALRPPPAFVPPSSPGVSAAAPSVTSMPFQRGPDAPDAPTPTGMRLHPPGPSVVTPPPPGSPSATPKVDVKMLLFAAAGAAVLAIFFALAISGLRRRHAQTTAVDDRDDLPAPTTIAAPAMEPPADPATTTSSDTTASAATTADPATTTAASTEEPAPTADPTTTATEPATAPTTKSTSARPWTAPTTKPTTTSTKTAPAPSSSGKKKPKPKPNFGY